MLVVARESDDGRAAGRGLLDVTEHAISVEVVLKHGDDRHLRVDERDRAVLHLARRISLRLDVRDLLQFEGPLQGHWIERPPAQVYATPSRPPLPPHLPPTPP